MNVVCYEQDCFETEPVAIYTSVHATHNVHLMHVQSGKWATLTKLT